MGRQQPVGNYLQKQSISKFSEKSANINSNIQGVDPKFIKRSKEQRIAIIILKNKEGKKKENEGGRNNFSY